MGTPVLGAVVTLPSARVALPLYGGISRKCGSTCQCNVPSAATNTNALQVLGSSSVLDVLPLWNHGVAPQSSASTPDPLVHKSSHGKIPIHPVNSTPCPVRYAPLNPSILLPSSPHYPPLILHALSPLLLLTLPFLHLPLTILPRRVSQRDLHQVEQYFDYRRYHFHDQVDVKGHRTCP